MYSKQEVNIVLNVKALLFDDLLLVICKSCTVINTLNNVYWHEKETSDSEA